MSTLFFWCGFNAIFAVARGSEEIGASLTGTSPRESACPCASLSPAHRRDRRLVLSCRYRPQGLASQYDTTRRLAHNPSPSDDEPSGPSRALPVPWMARSWGEAWLSGAFSTTVLFVRGSALKRRTCGVVAVAKGLVCRDASNAGSPRALVPEVGVEGARGCRGRCRAIAGAGP